LVNNEFDIEANNQAIRRLSCCLWRRERGLGVSLPKERQGSGRRFQKNEQIETFDLRKNLLMPNQKVVIGEFKGERCRKCMKLRGGRGRRRRRGFLSRSRRR